MGLVERHFSQEESLRGALFWKPGAANGAREAETYFIHRRRYAGIQNRGSLKSQSVEPCPQQVKIAVTLSEIRDADDRWRPMFSSDGADAGRSPAEHIRLFAGERRPALSCNPAPYSLRHHLAARPTYNGLH